MAVLQGRTIEEILELYKNYLNDDRINVIGLSFTLVIQELSSDRYINQFLNRLLILEKLNDYIIKNNINAKPIHMLGSSSWIEAIICNKYKFIRSNDTKLLSRLAKGKIMLEQKPIGKIDEKLFLLEQFDKQQHDVLQYNITHLKKAVIQSENYNWFI